MERYLELVPDAGANAAARALPVASPSPRSPCFTPGSGYAPPRGVLDLFELLESMDSDVESEVRRVRRGIQETRMLVRACREDSAARRLKTIEPVRGRQQ
ncbi:uncharacterized protein BXZ73DRAFT_97721 [Epithele typhae]|uniref:uncharacterized protein n=1 Tax=Epithele typhae TaxID=378194 RepID=UPI0020075DE9|nr:uncharacterized protein BXZ73DRAFT_97721 [Epithele typhae]KAH9942309.1 hypothetical protein BXZ73DRAFT_97721 [Epithele typhae]